jgi:hypothetical protein
MMEVSRLTPYRLILMIRLSYLSEEKISLTPPCRPTGRYTRTLTLKSSPKSGQTGSKRPHNQIFTSKSPLNRPKSLKSDHASPLFCKKMAFKA